MLINKKINQTFISKEDSAQKVLRLDQENLLKTFLTLISMKD